MAIRLLTNLSLELIAFALCDDEIVARQIGFDVGDVGDVGVVATEKVLAGNDTAETIVETTGGAGDCCA